MHRLPHLGPMDGYCGALHSQLSRHSLQKACKRVGATRYIAHPCYTPSNDHDHYDVALIELSPALTDLPQASCALDNGLNGSMGDPF